MSPLRNLFARSEQWRLEWGFRNCVSVAFVAFLYLYFPTKNHLTRYGAASTSFATVVTAFVKDVTIGATISNGWACLLGAFIATLYSYIYFQIVRTQYSDHVPLLVTLLCIFIPTFIFQYMEMVPITKKFAVGMVPLYLIGYRNKANPTFFIWGLFLAVLIGCGCALVGCFLPFPPRLASAELRERIEYFSVAMSSLLKDQSQSWLSTYKDNSKDVYSSSKVVRSRSESLRATRGHSQSVSSNPGLSPGVFVRKKVRSTSDLQVVVEDASVTAPNVILPLSEIILTKTAQKGSFTHTNPKRKYNTRFIRMELVNYLQESLPYLQSRNLETGFGFSRRVGNRCAKYVKLIQDILLIITKLESHIESMEKCLKFHYLYMAFFSRPNLHYGMTLYADSLAETIMTISNVLVVQSVLDDDLLTPGDEGFRAVEAAAKLMRARDYFDGEYLKARKDIFYPHPDEPGEDGLHPDATQEGPSENSAPTVDHTATVGSSLPAAPAVSPASPVGGPFIPIRARKFISKKEKAALRADTKAMLEVNSIIFLLDTMSRLLLEFWPAEDLVKMAQHDTLKPHPIAMHRAPPVVYEPLVEGEEGDSLTMKLPFWRNVNKFSNGARRFVWELFPTNQSHLIPTYTPGQPVKRWVLTKTIKQRLIMAAKVSVGMTVAAFYGIIANRPSPHLSSLTIAFLAGGAVTGINVMTCINRAAGTAVACVYSIMVAYIVAHWEHDWQRDLFIGFAVVLLQLPATYVRSYPLYAYSGTVTGFTVALILLARNISTQYAVNRIIDTYVGVAIYLAMELTIAVTFTEDELIADMARVFQGVQDRFINMHRNFQFFKAAEDSVAEVQSRIRGGTLTASEVTTELQRIESLRADIQNRKYLEVDSLQVLIRRQLQLGPFYRSEPAIWRPVIFPTSILEESVVLQKQAVNSIQIMIWAVKTCDGTFDGRVEKMIHKLDQKIKHKTRVKASHECAKHQEHRAEMTGHCDRLSVASTRSVSPASSTMSSPRANISILPEFKAVLLPLEPHFIEVEKFVSAVLIFLVAAMEQIADWKPALKAFEDAFEIPGLSGLVRPDCSRRRRSTCTDQARSSNMITELSAVAETRYAEQMGNITEDFPHHIYERLTHGKDDAFDTAEVDRLYLNYQRLIEGLQQGLATEGTIESGDVNTSGRITSNREIVVVNTLLSSTQQLIGALHGLTSVVSRMQAHRDIHVTQDGKRL